MEQGFEDAEGEQETSESSEQPAEDPSMAPTDTAGEADIEEEQQCARENAQRPITRPPLRIS